MHREGNERKWDRLMMEALRDAMLDHVPDDFAVSVAREATLQRLNDQTLEGRLLATAVILLAGLVLSAAVVFGDTWAGSVRFVVPVPALDAMLNWGLVIVLCLATSSALSRWTPRFRAMPNQE